MIVFISRDCDVNCVFSKILNEKGISVVAKSLVDFSPVDFQLPNAFDWIFFYSRRAASYFFLANPSLSPKTRYATIGAGTAAELKLHIGKVPDFTGDGVPETTASSFKNVALGQTVLFVRAESSKKSIQQLLANELNVLELIVYKNVPKTTVTKTDADILLFTSSLNAEAYLKTHSPEKNQLIAAIGRPTLETIQSMGYQQVYAAENPDENSLAMLIIEIFKNNKP